MPARSKAATSTPAEPTNFDALLEPSEAEKAVLLEMEETIAPVAPVAEEETFEQRRIRELQALLAEPEPEDEPEELTAEQILIRDLEAQLAQKQERLATNRPVSFGSSADSEGGQSILIHVLEDGFMAFGHLWYRGQEIEVYRGSREYKTTILKDGTSWLDLDSYGQTEKWGEPKFGEGSFRPRKGEVFSDSLVAEDQRRGRRIPLSVG